MKIRRSLSISMGIVTLLTMAGVAACAPTPTPAPPAQAPTAAPATTATRAPIPTSESVPGPADAAVKIDRIEGFGLFLADNADRTLYAYDKDTKDTSNCTGNCAQNWPAFIVHATPKAPNGVDPALLTTFKRADGSLQAEYDGRPLYYYVGDKAPGDVKGQGIGNVWHVLSPRGNPMLNPFSPGGTATPKS